MSRFVKIAEETYIDMDKVIGICNTQAKEQEGKILVRFDYDGGSAQSFWINAKLFRQYLKNLTMFDFTEEGL